MLLPVLLTLFITESLSENPGAKIRISQPGLDYAASVGVEIVSAAVKKLSIPDLKGEAKVAVGVEAEYSVSNIKISEFSKPDSAVSVQPGSGLTWSLTNIGISIHGDWHYRTKLGFIDIRDDGSFDGDIRGAGISVSVTLGMDGNSGSATIGSTSCSAQLPNINVRINGGASWLYNLFIDNVNEPVRQALEILVCEAARNAIDTDVAKELSTLPVQVVIDHNWLLDYRLVSVPGFSLGYIESSHKGEFFHKDDHSEATLQADILPNPATVNQMVTIWLSDYVLNTAGYVFYKRNILRTNVTASQLPPADRGYLDTTCNSTPICIGKLIPAVAKSFPNVSLELEIFLIESPQATITQAEIEGIMSGVIVYRARLLNGTLAYLLTTKVSLKVSLTAELENMIIKGKIAQLIPTVTVTDSAIGDISSAILDKVFNLAAKIFLVPQLNKVGQKGFPIPVIKHVAFYNTNLTFESHALRLTTDVKYSP